MKGVYVDHAAATPVAREVVAAMQPFLSEKFGNPSSFHGMGVEAREAVEDARVRVAKVLHARPSEMIFTSGGTESVNLAVLGAVRSLKQKGNHMITSSVEHESVLEACNYAKRAEGVKVTYVPVDKQGRVDVADVERAITPQTVLVSVMYANNEVGTIQPVKEIGKIARKQKVLFHTDACQAGLLDLDVRELGVDLLTLNGSKLYGPKGVGMLYKREGVPLVPLVFGGGQEFGVRSGTENVPGIVGFARALELVQVSRGEELKRLWELRKLLVDGVQEKVSGVTVYGHSSEVLPSHVSLGCKEVDADALLVMLNENGVYAAAGSACASRKESVSHVLRAMGVRGREADGVIRLTFGRETSREDMFRVVEIIAKSVKELRGER